MNKLLQFGMDKKEDERNALVLNLGRGTFDVSFLTIKNEPLFEGEDFSETLTRAKFKELTTDLFKRTLKPVQKVLEDADLTKKGIEEIVPVGGTTRIPKVRAHCGGSTKGKIQEPKGEEGDNMRYLYMSVQCDDDVTLTGHCGDAAALDIST